jgi:hypothetical protein
VHNAAAGVLSIETRNRAFSTALAAGRYTAAMAFLEAIAWLGVHGGDVIVALADEASLAFPPVRQAHPALSMAFHLVAREHGAPVTSAGRLTSLRNGTKAEPRDMNDPRERNPVAGALDLLRRVAHKAYGAVPLVRGEGAGWSVDFAPPSFAD